MDVSRTARWSLLLGGIAAVGALVALAVLFFGGSAPDEVDLSGLADGQDDQSADDDIPADDADADDGGATDDAASEDAEPTDDVSDAVDGDATDATWVVDPDAVAFDRASGAGTFVGYRVEEELSTIGSTTAVGRTSAVDGQVTIVAGEIVAAEVVADLTQLTSDESRRDGRLRSTLSSGSTARFVLGEPFGPLELGDDGEVAETTAVGELTIEGVTREVEVSLQAARLDGHVVVAGSLPIALSDFGVQAPSAPIVLSVSDAAIIEWQLYLSPTNA